ncbi:MAG: hypothetical protein ABIX46_05130 [Burkholderiaceae bacterium]
MNAPLPRIEGQDFRGVRDALDPPARCQRGVRSGGVPQALALTPMQRGDRERCGLKVRNSLL